jgi:aquaporin Z
VKALSIAHWREYAIEALLIGLFMVSASTFGVLLEHLGSPIRMQISDPFVRRALMGAAMGMTLIALVYSPLGGRSGAHMSPAVTLTFYRLGKVAGADAIAYVIAQFAGAVAGLQLAVLLLGTPLASPSVHYVATVPGPWGNAAAVVAEIVIGALQMTVVLTLSNHPAWSRWTGVAAGVCVALYIAFESPISGMSLNPARSLASAIPAHETGSLWIYFTAPVAGMLIAAESYVRRAGAARVFCAKLHHPDDVPCPFHCRHGELQSRSPHVEHAF